MSNKYLQKILTAKVYDIAKQTPLSCAKQLSNKVANHILLKREDMQETFSFKIRGAYNKMAHLTTVELEKGVICASAGNHAQGVALSAQKLKCKATIVMPCTAPKVKIQAVKDLGGEVILYGDSFSDAYEHALELKIKKNLTLIHAFDDPYIIAGQGTIAKEILSQYTKKIDVIFVPVGGGGLISGIAAYIKAVKPEIKIVGVQMTDSDCMNQSIVQKSIVSLEKVGLFSDGTAIKKVGEENFAISSLYVDEFILVNTDQVCAAIKDIYQDTRSIVEPAGALATAGIKEYIKKYSIENQTLISIISGANMNFDRLRFIVERAEENEVLLAVEIPEKRNSFKTLCHLIENYQITEFNYRMKNLETAHMFIGLSLNKLDESLSLQEAFESNEFFIQDLTNNELAKSHIKHMIGGHCEVIEKERLYSFTFQEKPHALINLLTQIEPHWNITLLHYQNQGADYGKALIGLELISDNVLDNLKNLGYYFIDETQNPAYISFLT